MDCYWSHLCCFQLQLGGLVLHDGQVAEMRTGEGKTLVATLPAYVNALTGGRACNALGCLKAYLRWLTGEGKTLVGTLPAYVNALTGEECMDRIWGGLLCGGLVPMVAHGPPAEERASPGSSTCPRWPHTWRPGTC